MIWAFFLLQTADVPVQVALETKGFGCAEVGIAPLASRRQAHVVDGKVFAGKGDGESWSGAKGWELTLAGVPVGRRLLLATWRRAVDGGEAATPYVDGRWIDVRAGLAATRLEVAPSRKGDVEIEPAEGVARGGVSFVPADVDGRVPDWSQRPEGPAFTAALRDGRAVFKGMRPGRYVFYPTLDHPDRPAPTVTALVEVKAGQTVRASLGR